MLNAILIDDEPNGLKTLELLLKKVAPEVRILGTATRAAKGIEMINSLKPDVVFLDINMPFMDGFEMLDKLQFKNFCLVFITAHQEYALKALKKSAIDFILKPISSQDVADAVKRVKKGIKELRPQIDFNSILKELNLSHGLRVDIPDKTGVEFVYAHDILFIEAKSNRSLVSLANGNSVEVTKGLKEYELQLCRDNSKFVRIHHSYIINIQHVSQYYKEDGGYVVIRDKTIPISRLKKDEFLNMINLSPDL
jgi:two-component system, LytTR family, response regulator